MNGELAGHWRNHPRRGEEFQYNEGWPRSAAARPLSLSLPFTPDNAPYRGATARTYFDNLLPDSEPLRKRLQSKFKAPSTDPFDLLGEIGRDCVGAVQILPEGQAPERLFEIRGEPLDEAGVERALERAVSAPGPGHSEDDDLRISIAGAQEKTALLMHEGRWQRPLGTTPSTHILKLPLGAVGNRQVDLSTSVENEWLCLRLLAAYGLPVARADIATFGAKKALVLERFDRKLADDGRWWMRIPQEDFCQATSTPPALKYEAHGGPGMERILRLLEQSSRRDADRQTFYRAQILFWMLAAPDGHAKNFSIFLEAGGSYRLTPLYDVVSAWPVSGEGPNQIDRYKVKLAMAVRGKNVHYLMRDILRRHWNETARRAGLGADAEPLIGELVGAAPRVVDVVSRDLPAGFPASVADPIFLGLIDSARRLEAMSPR
ncbi:MAG: type II toxin-antitoxin system HipA family toxin [Burkholderiales bacterium]